MIEIIKWTVIGYAALVVIGVVAVVLWWRRINRQRAEAIAAMEARKAGRSRAPLRSGSGWSPSRTAGPTRASAASPASSYEAPVAMPHVADSWRSAPAESHGHSLTGNGGSFDGAGASGDWGGSSSSSSPSFSSSDSSSSDSGSSSSGDW